MSGPVSSTSCRTSENRSYRWTAVVTIVAMLGFAGYVLAATGTNQGTKVVPISKDVKAAKSLAVQSVDGPAATPTVTASKHSGVTPLVAPSNDECAGAIVIPSAVLPVVTTPLDITDATPQDADGGEFTCAATDRTVWYSFTPTISGNYVFSSCNLTATGSNVYDTVIALFASADGLGACPQAAQLGCNDSAACGGPIAGAPYVDQGSLSAVLSAGTTYFVVVGHWADDIGGVTPGFQNVAVSVTLSPAPDNDTCSAPTPLTLGQVTLGTTASATNDYRSQGDVACFSGVGQTPTTAAGLDVVFSFTPPANGKYSFRYVQDDSAAALRGQNPALYLTTTCPAPAPGGPVVPGCVKGANRLTPNATASNENRSEHIDCVDLVAGTPYYLFFDDRVSAGFPNLGGPLGIDVLVCDPEAEPNEDTASAGAPACPTIGTASSAGDVDFFSLGTPPAGSKVFAGTDTPESNSDLVIDTNDFEMRITNLTDTLGYDNNDGTSQTGFDSPMIGGVTADGNPLYVRINNSLAGYPAPAAGVPVGAGPYRLFTRVETGVAQNEVDTPSNASYLTGNTVTNGGFVKGIAATSGELDCFRFLANAGDQLVAFSDNNPDRIPGTITNIYPILFDLVGAAPSGQGFRGQIVRNQLGASPGTLEGTTPSVTSNFLDYRARYSGMYMFCFGPTTDINASVNPPATSYPLPYQGSISINCGPVPSAGDHVTDIAIDLVAPAGPVNTGSVVEYTITLTNVGADTAMDVALTDVLPSQLNFLGLNVIDGFNGRNTACTSLPTAGTSDAPIECTNYSIAAGASVTYTLIAQVANCIGAGVDISNSASITTLTVDSNGGNDSAATLVSTSQDGSCADLLCTEDGCITNECTINDTCNGAVCESEPLNCDDNSLCTADSCDPADPVTPCLNDSSQLGDLCFDGNDCTFDTCDPLTFCAFPNTPGGLACDDFLSCTSGDTCNGFGGCIGLSVCDDGLPCTDDFADEGNACACDNPVSFPGTVCEDGNACTTGTICDGNGGAAENCNGGGPTDCNDNDPCTDDSCDSGTGCVHTATVCDDGNVCNGTETCDSNAGGCQPGTPVVCSASDQCHVAGVCDPDTGTCSNPNAADGTTCDDGNPATDGDACTAGVCAGSTCSSANSPRQKNYYKKLCNNRNAGEQITDADAACVGETTSTFAGISTAAEVCEVLTAAQPTKCDKAEGDLMTLALNICKERVCPADGISSHCGSNTTVGGNLSQADGLVSSPDRTNATCDLASCLANEVNLGISLDTFVPEAFEAADTIRVIGKELPAQQ